MATEKRTITLTDRAPVRITTSDWPEIASADWHNGEVECQSTRKAWIKVRQHEDGRTIVYGGSTSQYTSEPAPRAGYMIGRVAEAPGDDEIVRTIRAVAGDIGRPELAQECIASLPAEEI